MEVYAQHVAPARAGEGMEPLARPDLSEQAERMPQRRPDPGARISEIVGSAIFQRGVVLRDRVRGRFVKLWRVYPAVGVAFDQLPKGKTSDDLAWHGELCRSHGLRWFPFSAGEKLTEDRFKHFFAEAA